MNTISKFSHVKTLSKYLKKILPLHKIPPEVTPNLSQKNSLNIVHFLVHKRYVQEDLGWYQFKLILFY